MGLPWPISISVENGGRSKKELPRGGRWSILDVCGRERKKQKRSAFRQDKKCEYNIKELIQKLLEVGHVASGWKKQLQQAAQARGMPIFKDAEAVIDG
jgi:hypothetical protein